MISRMLPALLLVLALLAAACQETAAPTSGEPALKIGFINQETVFRESAPGKDGMDLLGKKSNDLRGVLDELRAAAEEAEASGDEEAIAKTGQAFQQKLGESQQLMQAEQERIVAAMTKAYHQAMEDYRKANNISVIFPAEVAVAFDAELDVTQGVIELLNKADISLEAAAAPSAEGGEAETGAEQQ